MSVPCSVNESLSPFLSRSRSLNSAREKQSGLEVIQRQIGHPEKEFGVVVAAGCGCMMVFDTVVEEAAVETEAR